MAKANWAYKPNGKIYDRQKKRTKKNRKKRAKKASTQSVRIWTDGAVYLNGRGKDGGYALVIDQNGYEETFYGYMKKGATNNIMELTAILRGLEKALENGMQDESMVVKTDSKYCINSITKWVKGWKRNGWLTKEGNPVKNVELIKDIDTACSHFKHLRFEWVKGHNGTRLNELADELASKAITDGRSKKIDENKLYIFSSNMPQAKSTAKVTHSVTETIHGLKWNVTIDIDGDTTYEEGTEDVYIEELSKKRAFDVIANMGLTGKHIIELIEE